MKYHYVYRITNKNLNIHYYGVRSSKIEPKLDLGIKYFSSSSDKEFIQKQKETPDNFKYKVVKIFETRLDAAQYEIKLHKKFNVGVNESFYNKAVQTSTGFDVAGKIHSDESKQKMSESSKNKKHSEETKQKISEAVSGENHPRFGIALSDETKQKISEALIGRPISDETKQKLSIIGSGENNPFFGKTHTEETKQKMSESGKVKIFSDEHKSNISRANSGRICIYNNAEKLNKMINPEDFSDYEFLGWIKGRYRS